jgi:hypothetical protein
MCAIALKQKLARGCGSPRERRPQDRLSKMEAEIDPPRAPSCREWISFLSGWHQIVHQAGYWRRRSVPPAPPTIWQFCEQYDLPIPQWAMLNAEIHGWYHVNPLIETLTVRHAYLSSLSGYGRQQLYEMESLIRRMERDRCLGQDGWIQTKPWRWAKPVGLLMQPAGGSNEVRPTDFDR